MTEVIEVTSGKDLNDFITFPLTLYSRDPFYVPPLIREMQKHFSQKNPFFHHAHVRYFIAKKNGEIRGRVVSLINKRHIEYHKENTGFFGFFESADDYETASALLDRVSDVLKREGMDIMRGPMSFSTNEECGLLIDGFHSHPILMTPYNPPYYIDLMKRYQLQKAKDLYAYILDIPDELPQKIHRVADIAAKTGVTVRPVNKKHFDRDMFIFKDVYNSAWEKNWGFIPLTDEELIYLSNNLKPVVVPELTLIAEKNAEPIGFMGILPDFNVVLKHMKGKLNPISILKAFYYSKKIKDLRVLLLGIKNEYRNKGIDALLLREAFKGVKRGGYKRVEFSWILEDNLPVQRLIGFVGGRLYKKYRIYEKRL
ncbi:MAG: GNAT family N-acetyltransferase [Thermodesulfovibrionales bacterium]|nr:GNAT family N-acetyltransferase [Thermodesulfovibrionales bacterium]